MSFGIFGSRVSGLLPSARWKENVAIFGTRRGDHLQMDITFEVPVLSESHAGHANLEVPIVP